jgi:hypothetical protein
MQVHVAEKYDRPVAFVFPGRDDHAAAPFLAAMPDGFVEGSPEIIPCGWGIIHRPESGSVNTFEDAGCFGGLAAGCDDCGQRKQNYCRFYIHLLRIRYWYADIVLPLNVNGSPV